jgi:hypothetical protein
MDQRLYDTVDYILNHALGRDLEVIQEALRKRLEGRRNRPPGFEPESFARDMSDSIQEQVSQSAQMIQGSVRSYVAALIKEKVPEIPEDHLKTLLDSMVPSPKKKRRIDNSESSSVEVPADMLLTMIEQFIAYSTDAMPAPQQVRLHEEIPDWQNKYWALFPGPVKETLSSYLKGKIDAESCWSAIRYHLFGDEQ